MPATFSETYYFGDSFTDVGVIFGALKSALEAQILPGLIAALGPDPTPEQIALAQQQASQLAEQQAFGVLQPFGIGPETAVTNEFTHAVYSGDVSGTTVLNYANAGARALGTQEPFGPGTGYDSNLGAQLSRFLAENAGSVAPDAAAVLFIGGNDFRDILGEAISDPDASVFDLLRAAREAVDLLLDELKDAAETLIDAGVGTVFFGTLPSSSFFPDSDQFDALSVYITDLALSIYNELLTLTAEALGDDGVDARIIDYGALANAIAEDPSGFGILADADDYLVDGSAFDSDQVAFWDPIHPAEAVHQAWGAYSALVMDGASTTVMDDSGTKSVQDRNDNVVFANGGDDTIRALNGDDVVFGGTGADRIFGGGGNDIASGGAGRDRLLGGSGSDILNGGRSDDVIRGGGGDDVMIDGLGSDDARGGLGDDVFVFVQGTLEGDASATQEIFRGGQGEDTLYLVLDETTYDSFETDGAASVLAGLGISIGGIETVVAIDGRAQVEDVLGGFAWFQDADYWGQIAAPTPEWLV